VGSAAETRPRGGDRLSTGRAAGHKSVSEIYTFRPFAELWYH